METNATASVTSRRTHSRRHRASASFLLLAPLIAWETLNATWYTMVFEAPTVVLPKTFVTLDNVSATMHYTGWDLLQPGTAITSSGPRAGLDSFAGYPSALIYLAAGVLAVVIGSRMRSTLLTAVALLPLFMSRQALAASRALVEDAIFGGQYMAPQSALFRFNLVVLISMAFAIFLTVVLFFDNRAERKRRIAEGEAVEPNFLDLISAQNQRVLDTADLRNRQTQQINV